MASSSHIAGDPREGLTQCRIREICRAYMTSDLTVPEVALAHKISKDRLRAILRAEGCQLRGRDHALRKSRFRMGKGPRLGEVFFGLAKDRLHHGDALLEAAKRILRQRDRIVYDAEVIGGPKGMIRVDRKLVTPAELIEMAGALA